MSILAELDHVSKNYGSIVALDDVTLGVRKGEIFTLIGPNGSGKTTLLRILACIEKPDSGDLYFNGEKVDNKNSGRVRQDVTLVFQKTSLFTASVYDNVAYGFKLRKMPKAQIKKEVNKVLEVVKLKEYADRHAKKLSGGEQQRVSLARALALNTSLLLLDEPTANLDPKNVSIIEEAIKDISQQKNTTIVMATHNIFQIQNIAQKGALLTNGHIVEIGTVDEILRGKSKNLSKFARLENIFSGTSKILSEGTSHIRLGNNFAIEAALREKGRVTVFIRPEDIIISRTKFESSARNVFKGKIVEVADEGSLVKLRVNAGKEFVVQITKRSFIEMGLNVDSQIYLTFKASSVQIV